MDVNPEMNCPGYKKGWSHKQPMKNGRAIQFTEHCPFSGHWHILVDYHHMSKDNVYKKGPIDADI